MHLSDPCEEPRENPARPEPDPDVFAWRLGELRRRKRRAAFRRLIRATRLVGLWVALCLPIVSGLRAQEPTIKSEPAAEKSDAKAGVPAEKAAPDPVADEAFKLSQTARTEDDFGKIAALCEAALARPDLAPKKRDYAANLAAWARNRRGQLRLDRGDAEGAAADFDAALAHDPKRWLAYLNRGILRAQKEDFGGAVGDFTKAIELNPRYERAWINRGEANYARGEFAAAVDDYSKALEIKADQPDLLIQRGHARGKLGRTDQAMQDFEQALRLDPKAHEAYVHRGDLRLDRGDYARAAADYRAAVQLAPESHRALVSTAWLLATCPQDNLRDPQRAVTYAVRAVQLLGEGNDDVRHRYLDVLAAAFAAAGNFDQAAQTSVQAIKAAPKDYETIYRERMGLYQRRQAYRHQVAPTGERTVIRSGRDT